MCSMHYKQPSKRERCKVTDAASIKSVTDASKCIFCAAGHSFFLDQGSTATFYERYMVESLGASGVTKGLSFGKATENCW